MRQVLLMVSILMLVSSCKLMKKKEPQEAGKTQTNMDKAIRPVAWAHTTNIYEVNVRQYTPEGTFNAFAKHLSRLKEMGVETLWFMPITPIAQKNKKGPLGSYYACSDYTSINPEFGTLEDFKRLVEQAHQLGMKVMIDWVANHTGWDHNWTVSHPDYYLHDSATNNFKIASGMDDIIELNYGNPELRKAMIDAMKYWVSTCDIDGYRCDLASWVEVDFWIEARPQVDAVKPLLWLGEYDELENPEYGQAFDISYSWKWMHHTEDFFNQKLPVDSLLALLKKYDDLGDTTMRAWFTTNHDENSWNGTEYEKYGNMAKALAVFSNTWNGVPLMYSGQELPLMKRLEFFKKDPIDWSEPVQLSEFYKTLLRLHATNPALRGGDPAVQTFLLKTTDPKHVLAYLRKNGKDEVLVILNLSQEADLHFEITDPALNGQFKNVFSSAANNFSSERAFEMQAWEYGVYAKDK